MSILTARRWTQLSVNAAVISNRLASIVLPRDCFLCDAASDNRFICANCEASLPRLPNHHCRVCALPTPLSNTCGACLKAPPAFDATHAAFVYDFPLNELIQSLKYQRRLASVSFLAEALISLTQHVAQIARPDIIIPVPLASVRLSFRGFNQSIELARPLAAHMQMKIARTTAIRSRDTVPQVSLPPKERVKNIRNAFECNADLSGKTVWVIDDVMTTGATLNELARVLKLQGAARVENFVVARATP